MSSYKKQYFRKLNPGDVNVEGRQSNGFTADKKGNVIFYSGLKDSELDYLAEIQNKDDIPLYYGNSYFGVIKSETHNNLNLGNDNYETLNEKVDANKIITGLNSPPPKIKPIIIGDSLTPSLYANSKKLKELQPNINSYDGKLWRSGLRVGPKILSGDYEGFSLYQYIEKYPVDAEVTHVFISIGTNDSYLEFKSTPIKGFVSLLKQKFPTASNSIYIIRGLYGYAHLEDNGIGYDNRPIPKIKDRMDSYYKLWSDLGVKILKNEVGAVTQHPGPNYPASMKLIGKEIDDIILNNPVTPPPPKQQPPTSPPVKENTPPPPAPQIDQYEVESDFVFLEDQEFELAPTQLTDVIDYYTVVVINDDGLTEVNTTGYGERVETEYKQERQGGNGLKPGKSKTAKQVIEAAKRMVDKAVAAYPMITDTKKYPDALNRLLAMCLVAYTECRFTPKNENPNHTFNTAKRASILKEGWNTLETFYAKFGVKAGEEGKKADGDAHTARPQDIFNASYGGRYGNGNEASGDGYRFRGRGYYGATFKSGYEKAGEALYGDKNRFVKNPDAMNTEPDATEIFLKAMFEGGVCAIGIGLLAYTTKEESVYGGKRKDGSKIYFQVGGEVEVTLPNGTKKKIRGDRPSNYTISKGANNLINGNTSQGYPDNFTNIYSCQELIDHIKSKLK